MQRIAVLLLCAGLWSGHAAAGPCEVLGGVVGGFAGGATGYGLMTRLGVASNWVAAGLYGAGIALASRGGTTAGQAGCDALADEVRWFGEMSCAYSGYDYDCAPVIDVARSLATDFLLCPACTYDEIFGAFLLADGMREDFLRNIQYRRAGHFAVTTRALRRDSIGKLDASVINSYFIGLQAGFQLLNTRTIYRSLK